jgi:hypothetical protein
VTRTYHKIEYDFVAKRGAFVGTFVKNAVGPFSLREKVRMREVKSKS